MRALRFSPEKPRIHKYYFKIDLNFKPNACFCLKCDSFNIFRNFRREPRSEKCEKRKTSLKREIFLFSQYFPPAENSMSTALIPLQLRLQRSRR